MGTVLFFDEANTTEAIGLIKEIMCDGTCNGKPLPDTCRTAYHCCVQSIQKVGLNISILNRYLDSYFAYECKLNKNFTLLHRSIISPDDQTSGRYCGVYTIQLVGPTIGPTVGRTFIWSNCWFNWLDRYLNGCFLHDPTVGPTGRPHSCMNTWRSGNPSSRLPIKDLTQMIKMKSFAASFIDSVGRLGDLIYV